MKWKNKEKTTAVTELTSSGVRMRRGQRELAAFVGSLRVAMATAFQPRIPNWWVSTPRGVV